MACLTALIGLTNTHYNEKVKEAQCRSEKDNRRSTQLRKCPLEPLITVDTKLSVQTCVCKYRTKLLPLVEGKLVSNGPKQPNKTQASNNQKMLENCQASREFHIGMTDRLPSKKEAPALLKVEVSPALLFMQLKVLRQLPTWTK